MCETDQMDTQPVETQEQTEFPLIGMFAHLPCSSGELPSEEFARRKQEEKALEVRHYAIAVEPMPDYRLLVTFDNQELRLFDVTPYLDHPAYRELKIPALFNTVKPAGLSVEWLHGQDLCPDELYYNSIPA